MAAAAAALLLSISFLMQEGAKAASGCCSRHGGVCDCNCCDGSALSNTCRSKMSACGGNADVVKAPSSFSGKVLKVLDGDTIEVRKDGKAVRIRLAEIDCPEKAQPFGAKAKQFTADLIGGKDVTVQVRTQDRYGRTVAEVLLLPDNRSVNEAILIAGLAWWYRDYSTDTHFGDLESAAKSARTGLWSDSDPIPPWVFRRNTSK